MIGEAGGQVRRKNGKNRQNSPEKEVPGRKLKTDDASRLFFMKKKAHGSLS
jgi:hypothetical protein